MKQLTDFELQLRITDAAMIIDEVRRAMPPGEAGKPSGNRYDNAYFAMSRAMNSLEEADAILTNPEGEE